MENSFIHDLLDPVDPEEDVSLVRESETHKLVFLDEMGFDSTYIHFDSPVVL
jgi:hypothetical protein